MNGPRADLPGGPGEILVVERKTVLCKGWGRWNTLADVITCIHRPRRSSSHYHFFSFRPPLFLRTTVCHRRKHSRLLPLPMTSVESVPPLLQSTVPILQPSHLEGDPTLATEILPGPPSLLSVQQSAVRKDTKKPSFALSYLPTSDPGSTYSLLGLAHTPTVVSMGVDGPRRKRPRTNKMCVSFLPVVLPLLTFARVLRFLIAAASKVPLCQHSNPGSQHEPDKRTVRLLSRPRTPTMWQRLGLPLLKTQPSDPLRLLIPTNLWLPDPIPCQIWMNPPLKSKSVSMGRRDPLPARIRGRGRKKKRGW